MSVVQHDYLVHNNQQSVIMNANSSQYMDMVGVKFLSAVTWNRMHSVP